MSRGKDTNSWAARMSQEYAEQTRRTDEAKTKALELLAELVWRSIELMEWDYNDEANEEFLGRVKECLKHGTASG